MNRDARLHMGMIGGLSAGVLVVVIYAGVYTLRQQDKLSQPSLKTRVQQIQQAIAEGDTLIDLAEADKVTRTFTKEYASDLVETADQSAQELDGAELDEPVREKGLVASRLAHDYAQAMSRLVKSDDPKAEAAAISGEISTLAQSAGALESSL